MTPVSGNQTGRGTRPGPKYCIYNGFRDLIPSYLGTRTLRFWLGEEVDAIICSKEGTLVSGLSMGP